MPGKTDGLLLAFDPVVPQRLRPEIERLLRTAIECDPGQSLAVTISRKDVLRWVVLVDGRPAPDLAALLDSAFRYRRNA